MAQDTFDTMTLDELKQRMNNAAPENFNTISGYALVNVLKPEAYEKEHIPGSINIPQGNEEAFHERFRPDKEIIVYCASFDCNASPSVAKRLTEMGFQHVHDYQGGMADWKAGDNLVSGA